jgi:hypothetical protein
VGILHIFHAGSMGVILYFFRKYGGVEKNVTPALSVSGVYIGICIKAFALNFFGPPILISSQQVQLFCRFFFGRKAQ